MPTPDDPATAMYRHRTDTLSVERGSGPPVVFSHGTLMDRTMFEPQLGALSEDYRTVAYDSRARTDQWAGPYDLDDLVADCRTLLDARGVDSCVLVGMSMGGMMALRFALAHPDRLDGIVLVDSMATPHTGDDRERYSGMTERAAEAGRIPDQLAAVVSNLLFGPTSIERRTDLVERWKRRWLTYPGEAVRAEVASWLYRDGVADRLDEIETPVLAVHGEEDLSIDPDRARETVEGLPNARLELIPDAGHSSNLENPQPVNAAVREFLEEVY
jgi:pimeloyl-ACP methyl ester carboxylesterase